MERAIAGLKWYNHTSNKKLKDITRAKDIEGIVKKLKWNFAGHIAREKGEKWWGGILINWIPRYGKRSRGRPARWEDEICDEFTILWQREAQDRKKWKAAVEANVQKWADGGQPL